MSNVFSPKIDGAAPNGVAVRQMLPSDLSGVMAIEQDIYLFPWTHGNFTDSLAAGYDAWLYEGDHGMLGYAVLMWALDEVHLLNLSVARAYQGQGRGRTMLRWLLNNVASRGARQIVLEVRVSNQIALALYRSEGFVELGMRRGYYPAAEHRREDARVFGQVLSPIAAAANLGQELWPRFAADRMLKGNSR